MLKKGSFYKQCSWLIVLILLFSVALFSCSEKVTLVQEEVLNQEQTTNILTSKIHQEEKEVKNIILLIGDGMGLGQVMTTRLSAIGKDGRLNMEIFPVTGIMKNHSSDALVTDSAASATAMACGIKTNNGMVGMDPDGKKYLSILEAAKKRSMLTGLIATSSITHATPACFGAHVESRDNETAIAKQLIDNKINVLFGGGRTFFLPKKDGGERRDGLDLIEEAQKQGYVYITTAREMAGINEPYVLGLFQKEALKTTGDEPELSELTEKAIKILNKNEDGFFLMIEGSQIDWASHEHDEKEMIKQTIKFDAAVKVAKDFADRDGHTLVIVTADHETGGLVVLGDEEGFEIKNKWTSREHSAMPIPVYAFGPGAYMFTGVYDNTDLAKKMAKLLDINDFPRIIVNGEVKVLDSDKYGSVICPQMGNYGNGDNQII
ncbi:MAG: alkaline phosphatase [Planctomycetota bacterium]|jgi:alkaline phosphatase